MSKIFRLSRKFWPVPVLGLVGYLYYNKEAIKINRETNFITNEMTNANFIKLINPVITHKFGLGLETHLSSKSLTSAIRDLKNPSSNKTKVTNPEIEHLSKTGLFHNKLIKIIAF